MNIDWLEPADEELLTELHKQLWESMSDPAFYNWPLAVFLDELKTSKAVVLKEEGELSAFILFRESATCLDVMVLGTHPQHQKKGYMQHLMRWLQSYAAEQGKGVALEVHHRNEAAERFYRKSGFELTRARKNYYRDGGDAHLYLWRKLD